MWASYSVIRISLAKQSLKSCCGSVAGLTDILVEIGPFNGDIWIQLLHFCCAQIAVFFRALFSIYIYIPYIYISLSLCLYLFLFNGGTLTVRVLMVQMACSYFLRQIFLPCFAMLEPAANSKELLQTLQTVKPLLSKFPLTLTLTLSHSPSCAAHSKLHYSHLTCMN